MFIILLILQVFWLILYNKEYFKNRL